MKDDENRMKFLCDPEQHKETLRLHRLENLRANHAEVKCADLERELATVTAQLQQKTAEADVLRSCKAEQDEGNGPCGICRECERDKTRAVTAQRDRAMELVKETTSAHKNVNDYEYNDCDSIKCELCLQYEILRNEITKEKEAK